MNTFVLQLQDVARSRRVPDVVSFIGEDASGSFGVLAHHERMMTSLVFGLARYRTADERWHYLILPGGLLYFLGNTLFIATRRFYEDDDMDRILGEMEARLQAEEEHLRALKQNMEHLEQEMLRRIWRLEIETGERT